MLVETLTAFITSLTETGRFRTIDGWQGEKVEELLQVAAKLPAAYIALGEIDFGEAPTAMGTNLSLDDSVWNVLVMADNVRNRKSGAVECYELIEATVAKLKKLPVGNGWLWPDNARLLAAKKGLFLYGISFRLETEE